MAEPGGSGPESGPLEIRAGGIGWPLVAVGSSMLGTSRLALEHNRIDALIGRSLLAFVAAGVVVVVARHVLLRARGPLLRLDDAGITFFDGLTVGWGEIGEVREVSKGTGLAFLPEAPAELPPLALVLFPASAEGVARRRTRRFGTPLVLFPAGLDVSKDEITAAIHRFGGGIPITLATAKAAPA